MKLMETMLISQAHILSNEGRVKCINPDFHICLHVNPKCTHLWSQNLRRLLYSHYFGDSLSAVPGYSGRLGWYSYLHNMVLSGPEFLSCYV